MERFLSRYYEFHERKIIGSLPFAIVSNNCWGYQLYKTCDRSYNTPFVGLFLYPNCYLKVCQNLTFFLCQPLKIVNHYSKYVTENTTYPVGHYGDVEIHFLHYSDVDDARKKWNARAPRLLKYYQEGNPIFYQFNDRDGASESDLKCFHRLVGNGRSISFSTFPLNIKNHYQVSLRHKDGNVVADGVKLYRARGFYFSLAKWLHESQS